MIKSHYHQYLSGLLFYIFFHQPFSRFAQQEPESLPDYDHGSSLEYPDLQGRWI